MNLNEIGAEVDAQPSDAELHQKAADALGRVNIPIAGNTGVGKSTLLKAVFGPECAAKAGTGKPETMTIDRYDVPDKPLTLWDTRGFETGDREAIDKVWAKIDADAKGKDAGQHIHVAWLCINSASSRVEPVHESFLKKLAERRVPCIVVLTKSSGESMREAAEKFAQPSTAIVEILADTQLVLRVLPETVAKLSGVGTLAGMAAAGISSGVATETLGQTYVRAITTYIQTGKPLISESLLDPILKAIELAAARTTVAA